MNGTYVTPAAPLLAIVEELAAAGVAHAVICPGSRSTPLALALQAADGIETHVHIDERAGAFFALGVAKAARAPVAILATSGTAVVEFAPAVAEARYGRVPLILLTADRPPELQGVGSPQTIDQGELYGRHAKWFAQLPVPEDSDEVAAEIRSAVSMAVDVALTAPAGPVQLNLPFREPLVPAGSLAGARAFEATSPPAVGSARIPAEAEVDRVVVAFAAARRPLIVCGPLDVDGAAVPLGVLASALGAPLLADGLSNLRDGEHDRDAVIVHHDTLLRSDSFRDQHGPDLVLRVGGPPTSKPLNALLDELAVPQLLVDDGGGWNAPAGPSLVDADTVALAEAVVGGIPANHRADPSWLEGWQRADRAVAAAYEAWFEGLAESFEGAAAWALRELPAETAVLAGNSMPVRDIDAFMPGSGQPRRMLGNRGANGIDGLLSTALGISVAQPHPVVAVVGDLGFLHDLNALVAAHRLGINATIVLLDNDGGGIFSFLPQAAADRPDAGLPQHYEALFGTPHGLDLGPVISALGARPQVVDHSTLPAALRAAGSRPGLDVLHMHTDRTRNVELHRAATAAALAALEASA